MRVPDAGFCADIARMRRVDFRFLPEAADRGTQPQQNLFIGSFAPGFPGQASLSEEPAGIVDQDAQKIVFTGRETNTKGPNDKG